MKNPSLNYYTDANTPLYYCTSLTYDNVQEDNENNMKKKGENEHEEIVEVPVFLNESDSMKTRKKKDKKPQVNAKTSDPSDIKLWDDEEAFITYHLKSLGLKSPPRTP